MSDNNQLLNVNQLKTHFFTENGTVPSVDGVSFTVNKGELVAIVGESGSGKSVTSLSIMGLVEDPGKIVGGEILFEEKDLAKYSNRQMRKIRGNDIAMIFQEPLTSLNPVFTIGNQLREAILQHQNVDKATAKKMSIDMLKQVGIPRADKVYNSFPHSLSGGMRQRVMIAMALSCNPKLLIADEPTTALDVTIQAQILELMKDLVKKMDTAIVLITHDLGVVAELVDRVVVMYAGQVVEQADVFSLFKDPKHPYTQGLLDSTPKIQDLDEELVSIKGTVPTPANMPNGCRFHPRCPHAMDHCVSQEPQLEKMEEGREVRCWLYDEEVMAHEQSKNSSEADTTK
ncbi:ABC transporter ATP-binding protein [Salipaludibacillus sp. CUR1]|uniref:ABC transporter ATP-binding protein n=1 Tax=Salipaludibacillus sp. CUR1 TaxID=2820003 RepID=UPI001E3FE321|nr:ABC transporter ATP-binding protein [Salipaludibacillus sp. CUR1]MCE7791679.1 ABC transporter ATP-binding protein [Salipaludibacillus sp. CUR1]